MNGRLRETVSGISLGVAGLAILLSLFLFVSYLKARQKLLDADSFCPVEQPVKWFGVFELTPPAVPRKIAVVVDATDRIPDAQKQEIADWFEIDAKFVQSLDENRFSKVAIYRLNEHISDEAAVFEKCAPPLKANPWIENPRLVKKKFEDEFHAKLLKVVGDLADESRKEFSPILEMVESKFDSYNEIVLVSDLMHNTQGHSFYENVGRIPGYAEFARTSYARRIAKNRNGKKLTAIHIIRKHLVLWQNKSLREFWREHMESDGGEFEVAKTLSTIAE